MAATRKRHRISGQALTLLGPFKAFDEALDGLASTYFKMVNAERFLIDAQLHSTNLIKLIHMDFTFDAKFV